MILGRQPSLGLAELESLYGPDKLQKVGNKAVIVDIDPCLMAFDRLGGSLKFCKLLTTLNTTKWSEIEQFLLKVSPEQSKLMPAGKMRLGLSVLGLNVDVKQLHKTGLSLKKAIRKQTERSVRFVPNEELELNSAKVLHNNLTGPNGWELVFICDGENQHTIVAQTVKVQGIGLYAKRDRGRPKRDARVGMLPPKLAQIIVNLAAGKLPEDKLESICDIPAGEQIPLPKLGQTILDPFCGTGVLLQEAYLMGYQIYGTDLEKRMVEYTSINLKWLRSDFLKSSTIVGRQPDQIEVGDATTHTWQSLDIVASEVYLGSHFTSSPSPEELERARSNCNLIIRNFMRNIHNQVRPGTRFCLAVPAWQVKTGEFKHLPLIDQIESLGYNRVKFKHADESELIYYRKDQIVARELLVLTRK